MKGSILLVAGVGACTNPVTTASRTGFTGPTGFINLLLAGLHPLAPNAGSVTITPAGGDAITVDLASADETIEVPAGDNSVQYVLPANHQLSAGQQNPQTVTVAVDQTLPVTINLVATGTARVVVTGLSGSISNGGSVVAQRTDAAGTAVTINVSVAGIGSAVIPSGTYNVTYTPPSGFTVPSSSPNPSTGVVVGLGTTTTTNFSVNSTSTPAGTVHVTVTGLAGSSFGGQVSARLTNNTGNTFTANLGSPVSGSTSTDLTGLPAGSYNVTYTAPSGYRLVAGQSNPQVIAVTSGATANAAFSAEVVPAGTGTVHVTATGLTGATAGGQVSAKLTNNTGNTFSATLSAPSAGSAAVDLSGLPPGSYNVTYTPPTGYQLVTGAQNPVVVSVTTGGTVNAPFSNEVVPAGAGAVHVTVTGLTTSPTGGQVSAKLTNNTGNTFSASLSVPAAGSSTADLTGMPPGSYNVTYTPPSGYRMVAGAQNPVVVAVTASGTGNASFATEVSPPASLVFGSDWTTGTGAGAAAVFDGGTWDNSVDGGGPANRLQVIPAAGLDFPSGMANVLKVLHDKTPSGYWNVNVENGWVLPAVGNSIWFRIYVRHDIGGTGGGFIHTVQTGPPGNCPYSAEWEFERSGATALHISLSHNGGSSSGSGAHTWETTLERMQTYRFEEQYIRQGTNSWKVHARIYDSSNNLIRSDADFLCTMHGNHTMATYTGNITTSTDCLRNKMIGQPDAYDRGSTDANHQHIYYGGFAVSMSDWCGPYQPGE